MPRDYNYDSDLAHDVRGAYQKISTAEKLRASPPAVLQRIGKLFLKWDAGFSRPTTRARNAVKQLVAVPLDLQSGHVPFERSLREAIRSAIVEEADGERAEHEAMEMDEDASYPKGSDPVAEFERNKKVRAIFMAAIKTDAGEQDIARVTRAIRSDAADSRERNPAKPYSSEET